MKTILYIHHVSSFGGASFCLLNIIKKLDRNNYSPVVLLKNQGPLVDELKQLGVDVFIEKSLATVPYNRSVFRYSSLKQLFKVVISKKRIKYWIENTRADIVHFNTMMMHPYCHVAFQMNKKVIIHMREHWPKEKHKKQLNWAVNNINRYTHKVIAINKTSAKILNLPEKTEIIYDWIDFSGRDDHFDFKTLFGENHKQLKVYLFLGGFQKIKGSLEVVRTFQESIKDKKARLLFVGSDSKDIKYEGLKGILKQILHIFKYFTYSDTVKKIMQNDNRIVCIPATNQVKTLIEQSYCIVAFPTKPHAILPIAESIWLGKPVISANTPEAKEYSNEGKSALLFEFNNVDEFSSMWRCSFDGEIEIYNKANEGKYVIKKTFSEEKNSNKLNILYKNI